MIQKPSESSQSDLQSKLIDAMAISRLDKEMLQNNRVDGGQKYDYHEVEVRNADHHKSKIFIVKNTDNQKIEQQIEEQVEENRVELEGQVSKILVTNLINHHKTPKATLESMEGILMKKSPHFLQGWQERYCVLNDKVLKYYLKNQREKPFGTLNFDIVTYSVEEEKDKQGNLLGFFLRPSQSLKVFHFKAQNQTRTKAWITAINLHVQASKGAQNALFSICHYFRFWRTDRITEPQFSSQVNNGDVLLFRGNSANCQLQRTFTRSEYDHVAILLRYGTTIYMFEATGYYGVGLIAWSDMMDNKWYDLYERISYRKLDLQRDPEFYENLEKFVKVNMGKKYSCAPQKLLKLKSTIFEANKAQNVKEERTFFCSELVAAAYKECNLLPQDLSASQYWPGSFSSEKDLKLLKGALLPELLVDFTN